MNQDSAEHSSVWSSDSSEERIRVLVGGDIVPTQSTLSVAAWGDMPTVAAAHDIAVGNLECPLTDANTRIRKCGPHLRAPKAAVQWLRAGGFTAMGLANNHIGDYGQAGVTDTLNVCGDGGLPTFGAGKNLADACRPLVISVRGRRVAFVGLAEIEFSTAGRASAGAAPLDAIALRDAITAGRANADYVIACIHGGNEHCPYPYPALVRLLRFGIDCGADAIICTHSHIACGWEMYNSKPVVYGIGNLWFLPPTSFRPTTWYEGYLASITMNGSAIHLEVIPYVQNRQVPGVHLLEGHMKTNFMSTLSELSAVIGNAALLETLWRKWVRERSTHYMSGLLGLSRPEQIALSKGGIWPSWRIRRSKLLVPLNLIRCSAHQEATKAVLEAVSDLNQAVRERQDPR